MEEDVEVHRFVHIEGEGAASKCLIPPKYTNTLRGSLIYLFIENEHHFKLLSAIYLAGTRVGIGPLGPSLIHY